MRFGRAFYAMATATLAAWSLLTGCSSEVKVHDISGPQRPFGEEFDGVPVRFASRHQVEVFQKQADGSYAKVHELELDLPDQSHLYAVGIDADVLSDHTLGLELEKDGTPKKVKTTTASKADDAVTQVGASVGQVSTAVAALEQKHQDLKAAEEKAAQDAATNRATAYLEYREAVEAALTQQAVVDNPPSDRSVAQQVAEESKLRVLKLKANQAAVRAGEEPPFPVEETLP